MKKIAIIALLLSIALGTEAQTRVKGVVIEVIEGDIIKVLSTDGDTIAIKFRNIECPEKEQDFGDKAMAYTTKICLKRDVTVLYDERDRDRNALGTVKLKNGDDIGVLLLEQGLAWHYMKGLAQGPNTSRYLDLERKAKEKKKGLWKESDPVAPWIFRNHQNKWLGKTSI